MRIVKTKHQMSDLMSDESYEGVRITKNLRIIARCEKTSLIECVLDSFSSPSENENGFAAAFVFGEDCLVSEKMLPARKIPAQNSKTQF